MDIRCLLIDLDQEYLENWQNKIDSKKMQMRTQVAANQRDAANLLSSGEYHACVLFAKRSGLKEQSILKTFHNSLAGLPSLQLIVCDNPAPDFLVDAFEFGVENFVMSSDWERELVNFSIRVCASFSDSCSPEAHAYAAMQGVRRAAPRKIREIIAELKEPALFDYLGSYVRGHIFATIGNYEEAIVNFQTSRKLNPFFIPAKSKLAEAMLISGKTDEAIELFLQLDKLNNRNIDRKINIANAFTDKGKMPESKKHFEEALKLDSKNKRLIEAKIHILLNSHQYNEAVSLIDELEEVGPHLASKLNDLGVRLSKAGKGKSALTLYQKAHKLVRTELRYKISVNAALAEIRLGDYKKALEFLDRGEKEYGGKFSKLDTIRAKALELMQAEGP